MADAHGTIRNGTAGMADADGTIRNGTAGWSRYVPNIKLCVVLLFLLLTCVIGLAWQVMKPQGPSIRVISLSVSNFSVSDSQLRGTYDIGFNMSNPNKKIDMSLDEFSVSMSHDKVELARGRVQEEAISLGRTREMNLRVHIVMEADTSTKLRRKEKKKVFAEVGEEYWRSKVVKFNLRMEVSVNFESGDWPPSSKLLNLNCGDFSVVFSRDHRDAGELLQRPLRRKDACRV